MESTTRSRGRKETTNGQESTAYPKPVSRISLTRRKEILRANGIKDQEALRFQKIATVTRKIVPRL